MAFERSKTSSSGSRWTMLQRGHADPAFRALGTQLLWVTKPLRGESDLGKGRCGGGDSCGLKPDGGKGSQE